jgi:predicted HicB family RNase H-like nuclease
MEGGRARTKSILVRLRPAEHRQLVQEARIAGKPLATWARERLLGGQ